MKTRTLGHDEIFIILLHSFTLLNSNFFKKVTKKYSICCSTQLVISIRINRKSRKTMHTQKCPCTKADCIFNMALKTV